MVLQQLDRALLSTPLQLVLRLLKQIDDLQLPPLAQRTMERRLSADAADLMEHVIPHNPGHGRRTAHYCTLLGKALMMPDEEVHDLRLAGLLHDIGLLTLDQQLLGRLEAWDAAGYARVQSHPRVGAELLQPFAYLCSAAVAIAHHHERWDGTGYPYGLRGSFIPLPARILAVADAYDAIEVPADTDPSLRQQIALRILKVGAGSQFDPTLVSIFASTLKQLRPDR